jgi:hypothetical protein
MFCIMQLQVIVCLQKKKKTYSQGPKEAYTKNAYVSLTTNKYSLICPGF